MQNTSIRFGVTGRAAVVAGCLLLAGFGHAGTRFARTLGGAGYDDFYSVHRTSDGGFILAGEVTQPDGTHTLGLCVKLDATGNVQWQKTLGESDQLTAFRDAQATSDGGTVLAGFATTDTDTWGVAQCTKLDASGNLQWQKSYSGVSSTFALDDFMAVQVARDGGYLLAGRSCAAGASASRGWCVKLDASGNALWSRIDTGSYKFNALLATPDGGWVTVGATATSVGTYNVDGYYLKIGPTGEIDTSCGDIVQDTSGTADNATAVESIPTASLTSSLSEDSAAAVAADATEPVTTFCSGASGPPISSIASKTGKPGSRATIFGSGFTATSRAGTGCWGH
ncbi:MAG: hypothetical protein HYX75_12500 [Acidobacteria bacterium]|nr:hypothetical protein [Acidobacteriota bacterium]